MIINIQDDILILHNHGILKRLLEDKTTKKNIMWATDAYNGFGVQYYRNEEIKPELITGKNSDIIKTRARKELEKQFERTRQRAEVFTPLWICKRMNEAAERLWFKDNVPVVESDNYADYTEHVLKDDKLFKKYIDSKRLEITCGESPYLVSRYDVATGEVIPVEKRIGILDRKLQAIGKYAIDEKEWFKWVIRAYQATFGYEFQGDNVLISRVNLLMTMGEYMEIRWDRKPTDKELEKLANIVSWNIWQMDGLTYTIPYRKAEEHAVQLDIFGLLQDEAEYIAHDANEILKQPYCRIYDWHNKKKSIEFHELKKGKNMKFDFIIGNPPYQEQVSEDENNASLSKQLFPSFIQESVDCAKTTSLITPSRWFTGDAQDKSFIKLRQFMKDNNHMKEIYIYKDAKEVFPNTEIKGGVNFFIYDNEYTGKVRFVNVEKGTEVEEIRDLFEDGLDIIISDRIDISILKKAKDHQDFVTLTTMTTGRNPFGIIGKPSFLNEVSSKTEEDGDILLRCKAGEVRWVKREKISKGLDKLDKYKVFISKSAGAPHKDKKVIGIPYVAGPGTACTDSLISIGSFDTSIEAENLAKYLKTKYLRYMVQILKTSQNVTQIVYKYVPVQDFTMNSDINWKKTISEIDQQLYKKYDLSIEEINHIEASVKEVE